MNESDGRQESTSQEAKSSRLKSSQVKSSQVKSGRFELYLYLNVYCINYDTVYHSKSIVYSLCMQYRKKY